MVKRHGLQTNLYQFVQTLVNVMITFRYRGG
jgi:hypothetical protein